MKNKEALLDQLFNTSIQEVIGWGKFDSLGGTPISKNSEDQLNQSVVTFFSHLLESDTSEEEKEKTKTSPLFHRIRQCFRDCYADHPLSALQEIERQLGDPGDSEARAKCIAHLLLPELAESDSEITKKWQLYDVKPNANPIQPNQVVLQLNALYTAPQTIPQSLPSSLALEWEKLKNNTEDKIADYDHPVAIFEQEENHELINCLTELNEEIEFEMKQGVLSKQDRMPVLISVSVTHKHLDRLCGDWIEWLLKKHQYEHLKCVVLTEDKIYTIKNSLLKKDYPIYTVLGKYAAHFNALKYSQLLFEKAYGIRAGFKLDTDEGIRSRDLFAATGKTWLQTMCHDLWGGEGTNDRGEKYYLGFNEGEYVNKADIDELGYARALRTPDVKPPKSYQGSEIFFSKAFAHGRCTSLYNQYQSLEDHISHPVVKGGGYGITNEGLRKTAPFTFSKVGRAEDQQFYFSGLAGACRGIFHPDLRIAHYKSSGGAVAQAEEKTVATRFIGDMYRLIIFSHIIQLLPEKWHHADKNKLKREIDPMPGVFAGRMSILQAFLNLHYKAYWFSSQGKAPLAEQLLTQGMDELLNLLKQIDDGSIKNEFNHESELWREFIQHVDTLADDEVRKVLDTFVV